MEHLCTVLAGRSPSLVLASGALTIDPGESRVLDGALNLETSVDRLQPLGNPHEI
jgi:hypothetical protein